MPSSISVFIPLYNHAEFVQSALWSALAQTEQPSEIVVIDDGSTDRSATVVAAIDDPRIRLLHQEHNLGGVSTIEGLNACNGEVIAVLNSDDAWYEQKLEKQLRYLEAHPKCGAVFTGVTQINRVGMPISNNDPLFRDQFTKTNRPREKWLETFFRNGNCLCASSAMIRTESLKKVGMFDARYTQLQDLDMWVRLLIGGYDIHVLNDDLTYYRILGNENMSSFNPENVRTFFLEHARILRNYWRISSIDDLAEIIPEIAATKGDDERLRLFHLARHTAKMPLLSHRLFALETMQKWGGELEATKLAAVWHDFHRKDYQEFLSTLPMAEGSAATSESNAKLSVDECKTVRLIGIVLRRIVRRIHASVSAVWR